jgi:uncharacterized protein YicC (UPF0701 family)
MTGYGEVKRKGICCEVKSWNHRFLNTILSLPEGLSGYEIRIKNLVQKYIERGSVFLKLYFTDSPIEPDFDKIQKYYDYLAKINQKFKMKNQLPIEFLLKLKKEPKLNWEEVREVIIDTLEKVVKMREEEGKKIQKEIEKRIKRIEEWVKLLRKKEEKTTIKMEEKESTESNFTEELTRISFHLREFKKKIKSQNPRGKFLIFLIQEIQREMNVIPMKCKEVDVVQKVIKIKEEIENIRQQLENLS